MAKKEVTKKRKNNAGTLVLILLAICILLIAVIFFLAFGGKNISGSGKFLKETFSLQSQISLYVGKNSSDAFGVYTDEEIVTGKVSETSETIKDNEDEVLDPLVDMDKKLEVNGKVTYKINEENAKKLLKVDLPSFSGVEFYIQDGNLLKVNLTETPSWWNSELDFLKVGEK